MKVVTELSLFVQNKPGVLAEICTDLKAAGVNIEAISVVDHTDHGVFRLVVHERRKALHALERRGLLVIEGEVLQVDLANYPGALETLARRLSRAKINIQYLYGTVGISTRARLFLRVSDLKRAKRLLGR